MTTNQNPENDHMDDVLESYDDDATNVTLGSRNDGVYVVRWLDDATREVQTFATEAEARVVLAEMLAAPGYTWR